MRSRDRGRRGVALLEAMVALTLLATAGLAWMTLAAQTSTSLETALEREQQVQAAAALMGRYARLSAADLESSAGRRRDAGLEVRVTIAARDLYEVSIVDPRSRTALIDAAFFRPSAEAPDAP